MKNKLLLSLALLVVAGVAVAAPPGSVNVRKDQNGNPAHPFYGGYSSIRNSATAAMQVCTGRCLLRAILMNTGLDTVHVRIVDSSVRGDNADTELKAIIPFKALQTAPFAMPLELNLLMEKGIIVKLSGASNGEEVTVIYQDLD